MGLFQPFLVEASDHVAGGLGRIVSVGVLDGAELFFADHTEGKHGTQQREGVKEELLELEAFLDTADGLAGGVPREPAGLQFAEPCQLEQVYGDIPAVEGEAAVGIGHVAVVLGKVAVFHHAGLAVLQGEYAHLLVWTSLGHHLGGGHAAAFAGEGPDECRVANAAQRVIYAVEEHVLHALFDKPGQSAALCQGAETAAVSVGHKGQAVVLVYHGLALGSEGADGTLLKKADVVPVHAKKLVLGKEVDGGLVVQGAGHDAPGNGVAHLCGQVLQAFRLQLE